MKPKNFPGRKQIRRIDALDRMRSVDFKTYSPLQKISREKEMKTIEIRIAQGGKHFTKKNRSSLGKRRQD